MSSSMYVVWMKTVGGRLKSDLSFSITFTYNTFPLPEVSAKRRIDVIAAGKGVLEARANHEGSSMADLYSPLAMPIDLVKAHQSLDRAVDKAFSTSARLETPEDRQKVLFRSYAKLTGQETLI